MIFKDKSHWFFIIEIRRNQKNRKRGDCFGEKMQDSKEPISESCDNLYEGSSAGESDTDPDCKGSRAVGELSQRGF